MSVQANQIQQAIIAVNRFGLGARSTELLDAQVNPKQWLFSQMKSPSFDLSIFNTQEAFEQFATYRKEQRKSREFPKDTNKDSINFSKPLRETQKKLLFDGLWYSVETAQPFTIRLLDFFSNHFSVSSSSIPLYTLAPLLEREAIAPHLFSRFEDMLIAVIQHPAMLIYLDNTKSTGPNSKIGKKNKKRGINENLAREIFELHTLGIDGGYTINDIQEVAKAISGWSVSYPHEKDNSGFIYRDRQHEPGKRIVMGREYNNLGLQQGRLILIDLARHPTTARFISKKIATHFINDMPDESLVDDMVNTWVKTKGDLRAVITTLINHPKSWEEDKRKFKTPREFVVSSLRALNLKHDISRPFFKGIIFHVTSMGQQPFGSGSPAGYPDNAKAWMGSDALMKRIDWTNRLNAVVPKLKLNALDIARNIFSDNISEQTLRTIKRAESDRQAKTLLFMSPEFQRR
jgi:uncharacterized protein (DUF1800 family)